MGGVNPVRCYGGGDTATSVAHGLFAQPEDNLDIPDDELGDAVLFRGCGSDRPAITDADLET